MLYRKKPIIVEAVQWNGTQESFLEILEELGDKGIGMSHDLKSFNVSFHVNTLEGTMNARKGDWIVKGIAGEIYPVQNDIFLATYEAV